MCLGLRIKVSKVKATREHRVRDHRAWPMRRLFQPHVLLEGQRRLLRFFREWARCGKIFNLCRHFLGGQLCLALYKVWS